MDIWSKQKRSEVMSKIRSKNTKPERILRSELFKKGFRFRIHQKKLAGKPDIVLPKYKVAVFVNGCFWHNHQDCKEGRIPSTNSNFWSKKLQRNVIRDKLNIKELRQNGWKVLIIWECEIERNLDQILKKLIANISKHSED